MPILTLLVDEVVGVLDVPEAVHPFETFFPAGLFQFGFKVEQLLRWQEVDRSTRLQMRVVTSE
jgi:hypothetical protein